MFLGIVILTAGVVAAQGLDPVPKTAWFAAIHKFKDCTGYQTVSLAADGSFITGDGVSDRDLSFPYTREDALTVLLNTCEFHRAAGPDRVPSREVELVNVLLSQPDRLAIFEALYERGNLPGKLHALVAFYILDRSRFLRRLNELPREGDLYAQNGCTIFPVPIRELLVDIENGKTASEYQWTAKHMSWLPKVHD